MFEFMHKYRVVILGVLLLGLVGLGAWTAIQGLFGPDTNPVVGTFRIPGTDERVEVHQEDLIDVARRIRQDRLARTLVGDEDEFLAAWCFIALRELARQLGADVSDAQVRERVGIGPDDRWPSKWLKRWYHDVFSISTALGLVMQDPGGVTYDRLFEKYKEEYVRLKADHVLFEEKDPESFNLDLKKEEDRKILEEFAKENPTVGQVNRIPERISLEAVWVRFKALPDEPDTYDFEAEFDKRWKDLAQDVSISEETLQARYQAHKAVYDELAEAIKARRKEGGEESGDQPSSFEVVKAFIEKELKVHTLLQRLREEAAKLDEAALAKDDALKSLAEKYGFKEGVRHKLTIADFNKIPEFGSPRCAGQLFVAARDKEKLGKPVDFTASPTQGLQPGVCDAPGAFMAVLRPVKYEPSREATIDDKPDAFLEAWRKSRVKEDVEGRAQAFLDKVDDLIEARIKDQRETFEAEAKKKADEEIAAAGLDPSKEDDKERIEEIRSRYQTEAEAKLEPLRAAHEAEVFALAAGELGLEIGHSPWLNQGLLGNPGYDDDPLPSERVRRLFRTRNLVTKLKNLEVGRIAEKYLDERAGLAAVCLLVEKREPTVEDLYRAEGTTQVQNLMRALSQERGARVTVSDLTYAKLKSPEWFDIQAPETERILKEAAEEEARKVERRRQRALQRAARQRERERRAAERRKAAQQQQTGDENGGNKNSEDG